MYVVFHLICILHTMNFVWDPIFIRFVFLRCFAMWCVCRWQSFKDFNYPCLNNSNQCGEPLLWGYTLHCNASVHTTCFILQYLYTHWLIASLHTGSLQRDVTKPVVIWFLVIWLPSFRGMMWCYSLKCMCHYEGERALM